MVLAGRAYTMILVVCASAVAVVFFSAMLSYTQGGLAAPLDDAFIYFQYGRNLAEGHFFEYSRGAGFSSGATSILYPVLLAAGYRIGFTGDNLVIFAYGLSALGFVATSVLAYLVVRPRYGQGAGLAAGLLISLNGWVAWGYLSMMEISLHGTLLLATVFLLSQALSRGAPVWPAMLTAAVLPFVRPEAILTTS